MTQLVSPSTGPTLPALVTALGSKAETRFIEFFAAQIRNKNTRLAYARDVAHFLRFCEDNALTLETVQPIDVARWVELGMDEVAVPTVKRRLSAVKHLFDWMVTGQIMPSNPAASVRGPSHKVDKGKTPVLSAEETRQLLDSLSGDDIVSLRDKAMISVMVYAFARVSATVALNVKDFTPRGTSWRLLLSEKGGKHNEVPCHHELVAALDDYIETAGLRDAPALPLFRTVTGGGRSGILGDIRMDRRSALAMVQRKARQAGIITPICNHSFRATGITNYMTNGGALEVAQNIAGHASPRTTRLYDRRNEEIALSEIERVRF